MQINGSRLRLLTLTIVLGTALVGCEGGVYYDANAGRLVNGAAPIRATETTAPNDRGQAPSPSDAVQPSSPAAQGSAAYGHPAYGAGGSWSPSSPSPSYDSSASSFDPTSRTPPAPQLQADGTPMKPQLANVSPPSGHAEGGNEVLITGSGFANAQVMFGTELARVKSQSSNAITVIAPDGIAGRPVTVVVTNRDGTYAVGGAYAYL
jgi:IPT/TIG domain-containing protein